MGLPTVKLMVRRGFTQDAAKAIRKAMESHEAKAISITECWHLIDDALQGLGIECIDKGSNLRSPAITYVNMGDTYDTTVMRISRRWVIGCWGDIVERGNYA